MDNMIMITNNMMLSSNHVISDGVILVTITNHVILIVNHEKQINYNSVCIPLTITFSNFYFYIETKGGYIDSSLILYM
jgi:hypothetical protein